MLAELFMLVVFQKDTHMSHIKIFDKMEDCMGISSTYKPEAFEVTCVQVKKDLVVEFNEKEQDVRITYK